ncbi:MAG: imidazoleglycerol-phosphate dehydratase HisB [Promethearchaeota archaeon]
MPPNVKTNRTAKFQRKTKETNISIKINIDGSGESNISTNIAFFDHMLELFTRHSGIDLEVSAEGDLDHHVTEDVGISLGTAILDALGNKKGIQRFGDKTIPMDEALAMCALDLSGRGYHHIDLKLRHVGKIEDIDGENLIHFLESLAINAKMNLHLIVQYGNNEHHKVEAAFKAVARAFCEAIQIIGDVIPSTKGVL